MSALREQLRTELAETVMRNGLVLWDDPDKVYATVVTDVIPPEATLYSFTGSWFDLRHQIEKHMTGRTAPSVVVYLPAARPKVDPLAELRAIGTKFNRRLPTLIKRALTGQVTDDRLHTLGQQCSTIDEAEAALASGEAAIDARLITLTGATTISAIAARLLAGIAADTALADTGLEGTVREMLAETFGGDYEDVAAGDLPVAVFRQIVLGQLDNALTALPDDLVNAHQSQSASQTSNGRSVIQAMRSLGDDDLRRAFVHLANEADQQLPLEKLVGWDDALETLDTTAALEKIAVREGIRRLETDDYHAAAALARSRLSSSWWVSSDSPHRARWQPRWLAVAALADLGAAIAAGLPPAATAAEILDWYAATGWQVDSHYRKSQLVKVNSGDALDELDGPFRNAQNIYETWLDQLLHAITAALAAGELANVTQQRSIHDTYIAKQPGPVCYLHVDALRYELGRDLATRLGQIDHKADVKLDFAVATPPTITPVGMAALLPGAADNFAIDLGADNRLVVRVGNDLVKSVPDRVERLRHAHGKVADLKLDDVANYENQQLTKNIAGVDLVLVRSTEIDADGETDHLAASWGSFSTTLSVLQTAVAKLLQAGIKHIVITADHGFLAVRKLAPDRRIDKPTAEHGEIHRRAWIGRGGDATGSTVKLPLANFGIRSDLDIIAPRGLGVFSTAGGLQFFHGGLSPQELVIPVITVHSREVAPEPQYTITLAVAGDTIQTGIVSVTLTMEGDLFNRTALVRVQLTHLGERVAGVVGGDGVDTATDTVEASTTQPRVVSLLVSQNLTAGSTVALEVLDAATGVRLCDRNVDVVANVTVVDDLD